MICLVKLDLLGYKKATRRCAATGGGKSNRQASNRKRFACRADGEIRNA